MTNDIYEVLNLIFNHSHVQIQNMFYSKKNLVYLITINNTPFVAKRFPDDRVKQMKTEEDILQRLPKDFKSPNIVDINEEYNLFLMEYIKGNNLCDIISNNFICYNKKTNFIEELSYWFSKFHNLMKTDKGYIIKGDAHIRNFICSNNDIWGVDFEEAVNGNPIKDIAEICVSILTTDPLFSKEKIDFCKIFIEGYKNDTKNPLNDFASVFNKTFENVIKRRNNARNILIHYRKNIDEIKKITNFE